MKIVEQKLELKIIMGSIKTKLIMLFINMLLLEKIINKIYIHQNTILANLKVIIKNLIILFILQ